MSNPPLTYVEFATRRNSPERWTVAGEPQAARGGLALSSIQITSRGAAEEAKVIQSIHWSSSPAPKSAPAESMTVLVRRSRTPADHVREIFWRASEPTVNLSHEMLAICRMRLLRYFLESKSRCLNASRRFGFEMDPTAPQDAAQFAVLLDSMNGIFEILENTVDLDIPPHPWACGKPKGGD
jgi:hypothetical protein